MEFEQISQMQEQEKMSQVLSHIILISTEIAKYTKEIQTIIEQKNIEVSASSIKNIESHIESQKEEIIKIHRTISESRNILPAVKKEEYIYPIIGGKENSDGTIDYSKAASFKYHHLEKEGESYKELSKEKDIYLSDKEIKTRIEELEGIIKEKAQTLIPECAKRGLNYIKENNLFQEIEKRYGISLDEQLQFNIDELKGTNGEVAAFYRKEIDERGISPSALAELRKQDKYDFYISNPHDLKQKKISLSSDELLNQARFQRESFERYVSIGHLMLDPEKDFLNDLDSSEGKILHTIKHRELLPSEFIKFLDKVKQASKICEQLKRKLIEDGKKNVKIEERIKFIMQAYENPTEIKLIGNKIIEEGFYNKLGAEIYFLAVDKIYDIDKSKDLDKQSEMATFRHFLIGKINEIKDSYKREKLINRVVGNLYYCNQSKDSMFWQDTYEPVREKIKRRSNLKEMLQGEICKKMFELEELTIEDIDQIEDLKKIAKEFAFAGS